MGFGLNTVVETRGLISQTDAALNANVDVKVSYNSYLAFGLSTGIETKRIDMNRAIYFGDQNLVGQNLNSNSFYTGLGLNFFASNLHFGAGFHYTQLESVYYNSNESYSIYLNGSYLFDLSDTWSIKPSLMYRHFATFNDLDLGLFLLYKDLIWGGVAYRFNNALIFFADFKITKFIRLGYSYDLGVRKTSDFNYGSHEISVEVSLPRNARKFERIAN